MPHLELPTQSAVPPMEPLARVDPSGALAEHHGNLVPK
jgi:hypothetical protein